MRSALRAPSASPGVARKRARSKFEPNRAACVRPSIRATECPPLGFAVTSARLDAQIPKVNPSLTLFPACRSLRGRRTRPRNLSPESSSMSPARPLRVTIF